MLSCTQALEGSQSHDEQAATSQPDDRGTMNVPSNQQQVSSAWIYELISLLQLSLHAGRLQTTDPN